LAESDRAGRRPLFWRGAESCRYPVRVGERRWCDGQRYEGGCPSCRLDGAVRL